MTGAGRVSVVRVDDLGHVLSGAGLCLATARAANLSNSYCIHIIRHTLHAAPVFKQDRPDGYKMIAPVPRSAPPTSGASGQTKP